jgi:hypothetical protein
VLTLPKQPALPAARDPHPLCACCTDVEPPLTSEPPLAAAAPLTSEPPLADAAPLTSEPTSAAMAAGPEPAGI